MHKKSSTIRFFVLRGVLIGLFFPLLAIVICFFLLTPEGYPLSISKIHRDFPLLWIIDTAPIVLGLVSYIVGTQVGKSNEGFMKEISENNEQLQHLINEKEVLLKEIHHRVKNNLQVITSLLSLQASFIKDTQAKALFRYSQYRINSMAMIHEMLYQSEEISRIDYGEYTRKLIDGLIISMRGSENKIEVDHDVKDIYLNIDTAIPLGLLINEVITNALKYGIPKEEPGRLHLSIKKVEGFKNYILHIGDNGVGFSEEINFRSSDSLGLMLIHKLSVQLKGNIEKDNQLKGTNYILYFQEIDQTS